MVLPTFQVLEFRAFFGWVRAVCWAVLVSHGKVFHVVGSKSYHGADRDPQNLAIVNSLVNRWSVQHSQNMWTVPGGQLVTVAGDFKR